MSIAPSTSQDAYLAPSTIAMSAVSVLAIIGPTDAPTLRDEMAARGQHVTLQQLEEALGMARQRCRVHVDGDRYISTSQHFLSMVAGYRAFLGCAARPIGPAPCDFFQDDRWLGRNVPAWTEPQKSSQLSAGVTEK